MPEGDTIFRTAETLRRWLVGRDVTGATSQVPAAPAERLIGQHVQAVEARGKHLLVRFESGDALHTHLRMTGSWHVYPAGAQWRRPASQARLVLEAGDHVAVCFNAPVVELLSPRSELLHPSLAGLGPDLLAEPLDLDGIRRRARLVDPKTAVADLLLDQRVMAGVGNIYRSEALFVARAHLGTPVSALSDDELDALVRAAAGLLRANVGGFVRDTGGGAGRPWVYRRGRHPCYRCNTAIASRRQGPDARSVWWCPSCQPERPPG